MADSIAHMDPEDVAPSRDVGHGNFTAVVLCEYEGMACAIKVVGGFSRERSLWQEAHTLAFVGPHPNIPTPYSIYMPRGGCATHLVTQWFEGPHLGTIIQKCCGEREERPADDPPRSMLAPVRNFLAIVGGMLSALLQAHKAGFVHLDLDAQHVIVRPSDGGTPSVMVIDWEMARRIGAGVERTYGKPAHLAPEILAQALGPGCKDDPSIPCVAAHPSMDVFSAGVLVCQLLTGAPASELRAQADGGTLADRLQTICDSMFELQHAGAVVRMLCGALASDPAERPSVAAMLGVFKMDKTEAERAEVEEKMVKAEAVENEDSPAGPARPSPNKEETSAAVDASAEATAPDALQPCGTGDGQAGGQSGDAHTAKGAVLLEEATPGVHGMRGKRGRAAGGVMARAKALVLRAVAKLQPRRRSHLRVSPEADPADGQL